MDKPVEIAAPANILQINLPKANQLKFSELRLPLEDISLKKLQEISQQRNNVLMSIENSGAQVAIQVSHF